MMLRSIHFLLYLMLLKAATIAQGVHSYNVFATTNSLKSTSNKFLVIHTIFLNEIYIYSSM